MTRTEIIQEMMKKRNCAMIVLGEFADQLGFDREETDPLTLCFGGGMMNGHVCGAVSAAYMVIGAHFGEVEKAEAVCDEFNKRFIEKHGSILCRELLGVDFSDREARDAAFEKGRTIEKCPDFMSSAIDILEELLE